MSNLTLICDCLGNLLKIFSGKEVLTFQQEKRRKHYITNKKRWSVNTRGFYCQLGNNLKH